MSIQGAMGIRLSGVDYIFYNHVDSQPSVLGYNVVQYIQEEAKAGGCALFIEQLKVGVGALVAVDPRTKPTQEQKDWCVGLGIANTSVGRQSLDDWYCLLHGTQGDLARTLCARFYNPFGHFLSNGLFCEFAYIINLDDTVLEFYKGSERRTGKRHEGRYWANLPAKELYPFDEARRGPGGTRFYETNTHGPVKLKLVMPLAEVADLSPPSVIDRMYGN